MPRQFEGTKWELEKRKQRFELYESIILSIAILGTAWSAYQAALWNGIQTFRLAAVAASSRAAMEKHLFTEQQFTLDGIQVLHIVDHLVEGRTKIIEFYVSRIRPEVARGRRGLDSAKAPGEPRHARTSTRDAGIHPART